MPYKFMTVTWIQNEQGEYLVGKKLQKIGVGKLNGPGGKVEEMKELEPAGKIPHMAETIPQTAVKEIQEETTLKVHERDLDLVGTFKISFEDDPSREFMLYVYRTDKYIGEPSIPEAEKEKIEKWQWVSKDEMLRLLREDQFMSDDKYWMPEVLEGKRVRGLIRYKDAKTFEVASKPIIEEVNLETKKGMRRL